MQRKKEKEKAMTGDISKYYLFVKNTFGTVNKMVGDIDASTYGNNDGFLIKNEAYNYFEANLDYKGYDHAAGHGGHRQREACDDRYGDH